MTELVHPAGDMGKLAAKRTFEAYVSFSTAVSEVCQILGYEHEIMGILVQKKKKKKQKGGRDSICGGTRQHDMQEWKHRANSTPGCMRPQSSLGRPSPAPTCYAGQGGCHW